MKKLGPWAVATAGVLIMLLAYVQVAIQGVYFDENGPPDDMNWLPLLFLGFIGLLLAVCGLIVAGRSSSGE